jgi:hypothetical protein
MEREGTAPSITHSFRTPLPLKNISRREASELNAAATAGGLEEDILQPPDLLLAPSVSLNAR